MSSICVALIKIIDHLKSIYQDSGNILTITKNEAFGAIAALLCISIEYYLMNMLAEYIFNDFNILLFSWLPFVHPSNLIAVTYIIASLFSGHYMIKSYTVKSTIKRRASFAIFYFCLIAALIFAIYIRGDSLLSEREISEFIKISLIIVMCIFGISASIISAYHAKLLVDFVSKIVVSLVYIIIFLVWLIWLVLSRSYLIFNIGVKIISDFFGLFRDFFMSIINLKGDDKANWKKPFIVLMTPRPVSEKNMERIRTNEEEIYAAVIIKPSVSNKK